MRTKRIPLTVPMEVYNRLKDEADRAEKSMNQYILRIIKKREIKVFPGARLVYMELYRIRVELQRLKNGKVTGLEKLIERVDELCQYCDTFLASLTKNVI